MSNEPYVVTLDLASPPAIIEKDSRRSDTVRQRLQQLDSSLTLDTFQRGDLFSEVKANNFWQEWKFKSFPEYLKQSGFDITPAKADDEILISNVSKQLGVGLVEKSAAKNSKLKVIYELDPHDTYTDPSTKNEEPMADIMRKLVTDAPNKTLKDIKAIVKQLKGEEKEDDEFTWLNARLRRDSKAVIMKAVEDIVAQSGSTFDLLTKEEKSISIGIAFERMSADWLADPNNQVEEFDENEAGHFVDSHDDSGGDDSQDESEYEQDEE